MTEISNFRYYAHCIGSQFYKDSLKKDVPLEHLVDKFHEAKFMLTDCYPILVEPSKTNVHYSTYNKGPVKDSFWKKNRDEILNGFQSGFKFLMFIKDTLVGNSQTIYSEYWCSQPMSMYGKMSSFLYVIMAIPHKNEMRYFIYPLRTKSGGKFLELYHGRYYSKKGTFDTFGLNLLTNLIRLSYSANEFEISGFKECFAKDMPNDIKKYRIKRFITLKEENKL